MSRIDQVLNFYMVEVGIGSNGCIIALVVKFSVRILQAKVAKYRTTFLYEFFVCDLDGSRYNRHCPLGWTHGFDLKIVVEELCVHLDLTSDQNEELLSRSALLH